MNKLIFIFTLFPFLCLGQNWVPINSNDVYNYQEANDNYITTSIRVDSFNVNQQDTIFYFNRTIKKCEGCSFAVEDSVLLVEQEDFLNLSFAKQPDQTYLFSGEISFLINPFALLDETWIFDETNNIEARVISVEEINLFDQLDSCKIIQLSSNDTIKTSKNFGIIDFNYQDKHFSLVGIQTRDLGEIIPKRFEFYDFEIGDVFQYRGSTFGFFDGFRFGVEKLTVLEKVETDEFINYTFQRITRDSFSNGSGGYDFVVSDDIYSEGFNKFSNFLLGVNFNNQIVDISLGGSTCGINDNQLLARPFYIDKNPMDNRVTIGTGNLVQNLSQPIEGNYTYTIGSDTMPQNNCFFDTYYVDKIGLGLVYLNVESFDYSRERRLIGYIKDGDTTGLIIPDEDLIVSTEEVTQEKVDFEVRPNPFSDKMTIHFKNEIPIDLQILSLDGRMLKEITEIGNIESLDVGLQEWAPGLYLVKVRYDGYNSIRKVIKQ